MGIGATISHAGLYITTYEQSGGFTAQMGSWGKLFCICTAALKAKKLLCSGERVHLQNFLMGVEGVTQIPILIAQLVDHFEIQLNLHSVSTTSPSYQRLDFCIYLGSHSLIH